MSRAFSSHTEALLALGCSLPPDPREAQLAWRRLARRWHPDRAKEPHAPEKFHEARLAYDYLKAWIDGKEEWSDAPARGEATAFEPFDFRAQSGHSGAPSSQGRPRWDGKGLRMSFRFLPSGMPHEVHLAFFSSWARNALWATETAAAQFSPSPADQLADGVIEFFKTYYPNGASTEQSAEIRRWSLEALWQVRSPRVVDLGRAVNAILAAQASAGGHLAESFTPSTLFFRPAGSGLCFFLPTALLSPSWVAADQQRDLAFYEMVAESFTFGDGSIESLERERIQSLDSDSRMRDSESYTPFACQMIRRKPRAFAFFARHSWFNLNDPLYSNLGFDPWLELVLDETARANCRDLILQSKGAEWIARVSEKAGNRRLVLIHEFEKPLIKTGAFRLLPKEMRTPLMKLWEEARALWLATGRKAARSKPLGQRLVEKLPFHKPPRTSDARADLFEAARAQDLEAFRLACGRCRAKFENPFVLREDGIPIAQFLLWQAGIHPAAESFARNGLAVIENTFGHRVFSDADPLKRRAIDWTFLVPPAQPGASA